MTHGFISFAAPMIGWCIEAAVLFFLALPLLLGLLMAFKLLRYRGWLAGVTVAWSMATLAASGNYIYNLIYWSSSRFPPGMNIAVCALTFLTPPFLFVLILTQSRRRLLWGLALLVLTGLAVLAMRSEYVERKERDAEAYRQGVKPLGPRTGTGLVRWWRDYRGRTEKVLLQGHVPEATPVVLLTDPFMRSFEPHFCTGVASAYSPPVSDPALLGNVTEVTGLKGCAQRWVQGLAVLERPVAAYQALSFQPFSGAPDRQIFTHPMVRQGFQKLAYDAANFDAGKAELSQAMGLRQAQLFLTALLPIRSAPNAFPCTGPVLLVSLHDLGNVQAVLPYCTLGWNLFQIDDDLYFAAVTQQPTPTGEEIMNPDTTYWLWRVEEKELKQLWPES